MITYREGRAVRRRKSRCGKYGHDEGREGRVRVGAR